MAGRPRATPATASRSEFATILGCAKSYVTQLGNQGRLIEGGDGRVLVAETLANLRATAGDKSRAAAPVAGAAFTDAAERDKHYSAELRRLEFERETGKVLVADQVVAAVAEAATLVRQALEAWAARLTPQLVSAGADETRTRALLTEAVGEVLRDLSHNLQSAQAPRRDGR